MKHENNPIKQLKQHKKYRRQIYKKTIKKLIKIVVQKMNKMVNGLQKKR